MTTLSRKRGPALRNLSRRPERDPLTRQRIRAADRRLAKTKRSLAKVAARKAKVAARKKGGS